MQRATAQLHRMNRVMNFARASLNDALTLDELASVACLSKYHFARVFADHFDETPMGFLQRVRLEYAARQLFYSAGQSITDVAFESGFQSSQSFSRAFRAHFGAAPRTFKAENRWSLKAFLKANPFADQIHIPRPKSPLAQSAPGQVRVETRPAYRIAYIRHKGVRGRQ